MDKSTTEQAPGARGDGFRCEVERPLDLHYELLIQARATAHLIASEDGQGQRDDLRGDAAYGLARQLDDVVTAYERGRPERTRQPVPERKPAMDPVLWVVVRADEMVALFDCAAAAANVDGKARQEHIASTGAQVARRLLESSTDYHRDWDCASPIDARWLSDASEWANVCLLLFRKLDPSQITSGCLANVGRRLAKTLCRRLEKLAGAA